MKLNKELIEQLRNGEISVENNGTLEQLREVLKAAFPEHYQTPIGDCKYYSRLLTSVDRWMGFWFKDKGKPTVKISDFYQPELPSQPKPKTNPIHYTVDGTTYSLNYQELKAEYNKVAAYSDEQFMDSLPEIAHLACIISYFKGLGNNATIGDKGIIHELIHLMTDPDEPTNDLQEIREKFNELIKLA